MGTTPKGRPERRFTPSGRPFVGWCPRQDSNLRSRLRRAVLYPLSYGGGTHFRAPGEISSSGLRMLNAPQVREHLRHSAPEELHQVCASRWPRGDARAPPRLGRMTPEQLRALLVQVAAQAVEAGELPPEVVAGPPGG